MILPMAQCTRCGLLVPAPDGFDVDLDVDAKIGTAFLNRVTKAAKTECLIFLRVARQDEAATAPDSS